MEVIEKGKKLLDPLGIKTSINPWTTTYASIKPNVVWVEDDFRLHNHAPLIWGGCFCEYHMEEYSKLAVKLGAKREGEKLTREEFVEGILKQGEVHPYRKVWLDISRKTMVDLAELLDDAVHKVSPATKVGLMSSSPSVHCAEGRDWDAVFKGLSGTNPPVSRPHLPSYSEVTSQNYLLGFSNVSRMTKAFLPNAASGGGYGAYLNTTRQEIIQACLSLYSAKRSTKGENKPSYS
jgi:hypothetical protein